MAAPARHGLRAGRHHLRQRAERLEERPQVRARRLHRGHPRQALPRGDEGHRLPGADPRRAGTTSACATATRRSSSARSSAATVGADAIRERFAHAASPGFDPERDLAAHRPRQPDDDADEREPGDPGDAAARRCATATARRSWPQRFRAFDTICSATQDRQDAVLRMLDEGGLDLMVVIGGYNSSNTQALARICAARLPTYHIDGADCVERRRDPPPPGGRARRDAHRGLAARRPGDASASPPAPPRRTTWWARWCGGSWPCGD